MKRLPRFIFLALALILAYGAWPFVTALQIRDAMIRGDSITLSRKIEWESLRASIKASITPDMAARLAADPEAPPPTLWQRVKVAVGASLTNTVVDRYVTPERLPALIGYRRMWRGTVQPAIAGGEEPPTVLADTMFGGTSIDRFVSFWKRLKSAVFHSPTYLEIEVVDKYTPARSYRATLELIGWEWKLTRLAVNGL
jgi:hypothetical protein